jgi:hypothetical protein
VALDFCHISTGCKLTAEAQIDIQTKKRKAQAKKITGFQVHIHDRVSIHHHKYMKTFMIIGHGLGFSLLRGTLPKC